MASVPSFCPHCRAQFHHANNDQAVACPVCGRLEQGASATEHLWFYVQNKQKIGPITRTELCRLVASGLLQPSIMVLQKGASKWMAVSAIEGLGPVCAEATVVLCAGGQEMLTATNPFQPTLAQAPVVLPTDHPQQGLLDPDPART